jgi:outer membrane biosynthesis protein TonB
MAGSAGNGVRTFEGLEIGLACFVALAAQLAFGAVLSASEPSTVQADIGDENAKPMAVAITPIVDEEALPILKLGGKKKAALPDMWQKPKPVPLKTKDKEIENAIQPSTQADPNAAPVLDAAVTEAGQEPSDAEVVAKNDQPELDANVDAGPDPSLTGEGSAAGSKDGTETDPLKAQAKDLYKAQLSSWFSSRFNIKGKIPFDVLKTLFAGATVTVTADRKVGGYTITKPSGNAVFDAELEKTLSGIQSSGAVLPPPPPMYPDILGSSVPLGFSCKVQKVCE